MAELEAIGITTADQAASLRFYGLIGVDVPDPGEDHVEATLHGGLNLMWDTEELIRQIEPDLPSPVRRRIVLAFASGTWPRYASSSFCSRPEMRQLPLMPWPTVGSWCGGIRSVRITIGY